MTETAISAHVSISTVNQLEILRIQNNAASASIAIQGAHIFEYTPINEKNLLFVSKAEPFNSESAIRGGIPVCWPWFGPHKEGHGQHGLVRTALWQYEIVSDTAQRTDLRFWIELDGSDIGFPHKAKAELFVSIGKTLVVSLTTTNLDNAPILISQALHSYFVCQDISDVRVHGLAGAVCFDSVSRKNVYVPHEFIFNKETDWIIRDKGQPLAFTGLGQHPIKLTRMGSRSIVVWNPWIEKSKTLSQFVAPEFQQMFCIETGNVSEDSRMIKPGKTHVMLMELSTESTHEIS